MSDYTDIQPELDDFENAVYGEEVRDSMISAIKKIHDIADRAAGAPDASSATAGQAPIADGQGGWAWGNIEAGGQPTAVNTASEMEDTEKLYLYLGDESGYQYGYIYAYTNGTWTSTGLYGKGEDGASGADGYSPTASVSQTATGVSISITDKDGTTTATVENGTATDEQVASWLNEHPEATTTVQDGAITTTKLADGAVTEDKIDPNLELGGYTVKDWSKPVTYYNIDIDNNIGTAGDRANDMSKYPCPNFTDSYMALIAPYGNSDPLNNRLTILGTRINADKTYLTVDGVRYVIAMWHIALETEETPESQAGTSWKIRVGTTAAGGYSNATTVIVANRTIEEITPEFIRNQYKTVSVSDNFKKAVESAKADASDISSLNGKLWLALGDSYTNQLCGGGIEDETPQASTSGRWGALATKLGMTLYSYGIVSSTIRMSSDNMAHDTAAYKPMVNRVDTLIANHSSDADNVGLITFMGGANDGWSADKIGTIESDEYYTIYGALHSIFAKLINAFPKATILVVLQPQNWANTTTKGNLDAVQYGLVGMYTKETAVRDCAEMYSLPYCDCCFDWYNPINPNYRSFWKTDKIHLSDTGNEMLTQKVEAKIIELFS